jgi:hypothetical protein
MTLWSFVSCGSIKEILFKLGQSAIIKTDPFERPEMNNSSIM